jgi:hypothetical protein
MRSIVLTDDAVRRVLPMSAAVDRIESALREHAAGTLVAPPRFRVDVAKGALIFTAGAVTHYDKAVGFRVYDRFQESHASHGQVVVVCDSDTGDFKGVIVGGHLGAMRTGPWAASPSRPWHAPTPPALPSSAQAGRPARSSGRLPWCATAPRSRSIAQTLPTARPSPARCARRST